MQSKLKFKVDKNAGKKGKKLDEKDRLEIEKQMKESKSYNDVEDMGIWCVYMCV